MKQLTREEMIDKVIESINSPRVGRKANVKRNLLYVHTALGGTFIEVEEEESNEASKIL